MRYCCYDTAMYDFGELRRKEWRPAAQTSPLQSRSFHSAPVDAFAPGRQRDGAAAGEQGQRPARWGLPPAGRAAADRGSPTAGGGGPAVSGGLCRQRQTAEWNVLRGSRPVPVPVPVPVPMPLRPVCPHSPGPAPAEGCCGPHGYDRHMATTATSGCGRLPTRCCRCLPTGCWQLPGRGLSGRARESGYRIADGKPSADRRPVLCRA
jgi:hypothetical protein